MRRCPGVRGCSQAGTPTLTSGCCRSRGRALLQDKGLVGCCPFAAALSSALQPIPCPRTILAPSVSFPPWHFTQHPGSAGAPSHAELPMSLGATEATYGPHGAPPPCAPWLAGPPAGTGLRRGRCPPGSRVRGVRGLLVLHPKVPVPGKGWDQRQGWTEQQLALGRKVCKESTEHRLPGVSEGKFMHRL